MVDIVTIACPIGLNEPNIDQSIAPVWTDGENLYHVASGQIEARAVDGEVALTKYVTSDPIKAQPGRVNIVVGMSGLEALAAMGLSVKAYPEF